MKAAATVVSWKPKLKVKVQTQAFNVFPGSPGFFEMTDPGRCETVLSYDQFEQESLKPIYDHSAVFRRKRSQSLYDALFTNFTERKQLYGFMLHGTMFDPDFPYWNLRKIKNELDATMARKVVSGVSRSSIISGTGASTFQFHHEDLDLASINYLHRGADKSWFVVDPHDNAGYEELIHTQYREKCLDGTEHKLWFQQPDVLIDHGINVIQVIVNKKKSFSFRSFVHCIFKLFF